MANPENLIPQAHQLTVEEQSKGGTNSGIARKQKKTLKQIGDMIGGLDIKSEKNKEILKQAGIEEEDMINDVAMLFRLSQRAQNGEPKAIELLAKLRGQLKIDEPLANIQIQSVNINFGDKKVINGEEA